MTRSCILWYLVISGVLGVLTIRNNESEPQTKPETEPEPGLPEPVPDWSTAFDTWKWAWPLHVYLFGVLYVVVAMTSCVNLAIELAVRRWKFNRLKVSFFSQMAIFGTTRAILLFIDPYISKRLSNGLPTFIVWSLGLPIILSTFSLLLLALVDTTRIHLAPPRFQNLMTVSIISIINVIIMLVIDVIVIRFFDTGILVFICQLYLALFGVFLSLGFLYVAHKLSSNTTDSTNALPSNRLRRLQYLVYTSAVIGLILVGSEVYSATEVFGVLKGSEEIPPWPWLGLQTCARIIEVTMCVILSLVFKRTKTSVQNVAETSRTDELQQVR